MTDEKFIIQTYGKSELAMIYFPKLTEKSATKKFRSWLRANPRCAGFIDPKRHDYQPKEVAIIVYEIGEPTGYE